MPPGDIDSRLTLNTRQFSSGLTASQKRLEQFGEAGVRIFELLTQVAQGFQNVVSGLKLPEIRPNVTVNFKDSGLTAYRTELDGAYVSTVGLEAATQKLGGAAGALSGPLGQAGGGARGVGEEAAQAAPKIDRLYNAMDRLQQVAAVLASGAGVFTFYRKLEGAAGTTQSAQVGLNLYNRELAKANETSEAGQAVLERLGDRFKVNSTLIAGDAAGILRYGASLRATEEILLRAGASAVARQKTFAAGSNAATEALNGEYSAALNLIGVSGNLSTYFQRMAKEQKTSVDQLTKAQKVEAFLNLLRAETQTELEALSEIYVGYSAAVQRVADSQVTASQKTGAVVIPALTALKNLYANLLDLYSSLPRPVQALAVGTATLGVAATALVVSYISLRALLFNQRAIGPAILDLLKSETIARGRLGAVILTQAKAYDLLSKEQLEVAEKSVQAATASAAAAGKVGSLRALLSAPIKGGLLLELGALFAIARQASEYLNVIQPLVDSVATAFASVELPKFVKRLRDTVAGGELFATAFRQGVLYTVSALTLSLAGLGLRLEQTGLKFQYLKDLVTQGPGKAMELLQERAAALDTKYANLTNRILDNTAAYERQNTNIYLAASGLEDYASSTEIAADGTRKLTAEAQALRDKFAERLDELEPEVDTSTLKGQVTEATKELDALIKDLHVEIDKLPLGDALRRQLQVFLRSAQDTRRAQVGAIYSAALVEAEEEAANATVGAMQDSAARVTAERDRELAAAQKAFEERTALLKVGSERYNEFLALYNQQSAAIQTKATADLRADAREKLEAARELAEQLTQAEADLSSRQVASSDDALVRIRGEYAANAQQIRSDTRALLRDIDRALQDRIVSEEQASAEVQRIGRLQTAQLAQNQRELSEAVRLEAQRRANFIEDQYSAVRAYEAAFEAERQRTRGDDLGAVRTDLTERLRIVEQGLQRELQTEGLTRAQITAITQKAEADRIQARVEAGRQIEQIMQDEVARERNFRNELRAVERQNEVGAAQDAGKERAAAAAEQAGILADLQSSLDQELAAVSLSENEKTDVRALNRAKVETAEAAYTRKLVGFAEAEVEVVRKAQEEATRARTEAIEGSLPRLIRQFGLEQAARLKSDQEVLDDFEGTYQQRQEIVARQGQREVTFTKQFTGQLLKEQRSALETYQKAFLEAEATMLGAREDAAGAALAAAQKVTGFSVDRLALRDEQAAYETLQLTLQDTVARSGEVVDAVRIRASSARATADDVGALIAAEDAQVAAQGKVVDATQAQIDRLKGLRDAQLEIIRGGSDVLAFSDAASKVTGRDPNRASVTGFIEEQQDALVEVLEQQEKANVPLRDQLATLQEIVGLEERLRESGEKGLSQGQVGYIDERQRELLQNYPAEAAKALSASNDIGGQIRRLTTQLTEAQQKFTDLLGTVTKANVLDLSVRFDDREIREELEAAQVVLTETFGTKAAERISKHFAAGLSLEAVLRQEMANASNMVQAQLDAAGTASGKSFAAAFATGFQSAGDLIDDAVRDVLQPIQQLLPSLGGGSGSRPGSSGLGALSSTPYINSAAPKLPDLTRMVTSLASSVRTLSAVPTLRTLPGSVGGGGDEYYSFHLGEGLMPVDDLTLMSGSKFGRDLKQTLRSRARMGHRPPLRGKKRF